MIKYIYATKNKLSGNFNSPMLHDFPKDAAAEAFAISAKEAPKDARVNELEVHFLGTFDTKTGIVTSEPEFIVDLGSVVNVREEEKK